MKYKKIMPKKLPLTLILILQANSLISSEPGFSRKVFDQLFLPLSHKKATTPLITYDPSKGSIKLEYNHRLAVYPHIKIRAPSTLSYLYRASVICKTGNTNLKIKTNIVASDNIDPKNIQSHLHAIIEMRKHCVDVLNDLKKRTPTLNWTEIDHLDPRHTTRKQLIAAFEKEIKLLNWYNKNKQSPKTLLHRIRISQETDQQRIKIVEAIYMHCIKEERMILLLQEKNRKGTPFLSDLAKLVYLYL